MSSELERMLVSFPLLSAVWTLSNTFFAESNGKKLPMLMSPSNVWVSSFQPASVRHTAGPS